MSVLKIELDTDDCVVLTIVGNALLDIAGLSENVDLVDLSAIPASLKEQNPIESNTSHLETTEVKQGTALDAAVPVIDTDRYPWDKRIHSTAHSTNANGTWKVLRRPKIFADDQKAWEAFIERIRAELRGDPEETKDTQEGDDPAVVFGNDENPAAGMEGEQTTTEKTETPVITNDVPADFPALMKFITSNGDKVTIPQVGVICTNFGLTALPDLMKAENADLIPMIYNSVLEMIANGASDES